MALRPTRVFKGTDQAEHLYASLLAGPDVPVRIDAGAGNDGLFGSSGADLLNGDAGNDYVSAGAGDDTVSGGTGQDQVWAGLGHDSVLGGDGDDYLNGELGNDTLRGDAGNDQIWGGAGNDSLAGGTGHDFLSGDDGNDTLLGGAGNDQISGGAGNDTVLHVLAENRGATDYADGGAGTDTLRLEMARADWFDAATQADLARYAAFMASGTGGAFRFGFGLTAANFENTTLTVDGRTVTLADDPVVARADSAALTEEGTAAGNLLANDTVRDLVARIDLVKGPNKGDLVLLPDGEWRYDPGTAYQSLRAGQSVREVVTYRVTDADGDTGEAKLILTITGENDAATITGRATGQVTEDAAVTKASGRLTVADADSGESRFLAPASLEGTYGRFTFDARSGAWTYTLDNARAETQALLAAETQLERLTVTSLDGTASETITVTVVGAADRAVIGLPDQAMVTEDLAPSAEGLLLATGTIPISGLTGGGFRTAVAGAAGNLGTLTLQANGAYTYSVANAATQYLGAGATKVDTFTVEATDGTTKDVAFTIHGTNDGPALAGPLSDAATEGGASFARDLLGGASDADAGETLSLAIRNVTYSVDGGPAGTAPPFGLGLFGTTLFVDPSSAGFQSLAEGAKQVITVAYEVVDRNGTAVAQTETITITGVGDTDATPIIDRVVTTLTPDTTVKASFSITVEELPTKFDVTLLQDLSGSFYDDLPNVRAQFSGLYDTLRAAGDAAFAVTSFVDKPVIPFGTGDDYIYRTHLATSTDKAAIQTALDGLVLRNGYDGPEGQLEALMHAALRSDEVGYRSGSQKFVVLFTDAPPHVAGDHASAGANDLDAAVEWEDYPSIAAVGEILKAQNVFPIFAVTPGNETTYRNIVSSWGTGAVTELSWNSSNVASTLVSALRSAAPDITATVTSDDFGMVRAITPDTLTRPAPGTYDFELTLSIDESVASYGSDRVIVNVPGFGEVAVDITVPRLDRDGTAEADTIVGTNGPNGLFGLAGGDMIDGKGGDDLIDGGAGADLLTGGDGDDTFVFRRGEAAGDGVTDFDGKGAAAGDRLLFLGYGAGATFERVSATEWRIATSEGDVSEIVTLGSAAVHASDYAFA